MRLLLVNSAWPESWGGGEKWTVDAAEWFQEQRYSAAVCGRPDSMLVQAAKKRGLETFETKFGGDFDPFAVGRAKKILKRYRPDCVIVNFNKEARQFGTAARSLNIPLLARHGFPLLQNKFRHRQILKRYITRLVVNAETIRDGYARDGLDVASAIVIHNGVKPVAPTPGDLRSRYGIHEHDPLVLAAGRLESQKRFDRVIEIARRLCPQNPNLRFVILGSGILRDPLQKMIDDLNLGDRVQLGKFLRNFAAVAGDADLFLLTSDSEGTPNVLLEAMAAGVCCLATPVGSVPQIFGEEFRELLLGDSIDDMAAQVSDLLAAAERRREIGERMKARVATEFSFEKSMRQYERLLAQLTMRRT